jgi:hypothetical protein
VTGCSTTSATGIPGQVPSAARQCRTSSGGRLVHFLSSSQWILHWLLFTGDSGEQAVVTTRYPECFDLTPDDIEAYAGTRKGYQICADTFLEFVWRFWIENETWFALSVDKQPLTPAQDEYVRHYAP